MWSVYGVQGRAPSVGAKPARHTAQELLLTSLSVPTGCSKLLWTDFKVSPSRRGKARFQRAGHTGCGDRGPWVQPASQHPLDFSVLQCLIINRNSKVAVLLVLTACLPASLELRCVEIKETKDPEGRVWVLWPRARASWLHHFLAAGAWEAFSPNPTSLSVKGGDASRTVRGQVGNRGLLWFKAEDGGKPSVQCL